MDRLGLYVNKMYMGLILGLLGPCLGFFLFFLITNLAYGYTLSRFIELVFSNSSSHSATIAISSVFNLGLFFLTLNRNYLKATQGVILATFIYAAIMLYFKYAS